LSNKKRRLTIEERLGFSSLLSKEKLTKIERRMTKKGHNKGSVRSHNQIKENAKEVGMRKVRDIEFEKELMEMKAWLNVLMELLQQDVEDHRCGWVL